MKIFISGGCKNGKSAFAQKLALKQRKPDAPLYYIAAMQSADKEDDERIARHISEREGLSFETIEIPRDISELKRKCALNGSFLLDSLTALLANEMFAGGQLNSDAPVKISNDLLSLLQDIDDIVLVSDYIYSDAMKYHKWTEMYRAGLASIDKVCAKACDIVLEVCYGSLIVHKGEELYKKIC